MYQKVQCTCKVVVLPTLHLLLFLTFSLSSRRGIVKSLLLRGERDSEISEDDPIVLINKVTNKYAVALYSSLVHIVSEEKRKAAIDGSWIDKQQQQQQKLNKTKQKKKKKTLPLCYISFCLWVGRNCQTTTYTFWIKKIPRLTPGLSKMTQDKPS